jgi:hypothetical protein
MEPRGTQYLSQLFFTAIFKWEPTTGTFTLLHSPFPNHKIKLTFLHLWF